jgi:methylenetetrahydrofolate dehydrogenase (NADP+)/methenyltetrahydrofolate cyclohydrolase
MIVDGKHIADMLVAELAHERTSLPKKVTLGVLLGKEDAASASFVRIKERRAEELEVALMRYEVSPEMTTEVLLQTLPDFLEQVEGVIVQLPLPPHIDGEQVLRAVPAEKDVDGLNQRISPFVEAPVAAAIREILKRTGVSVAGKQAVVLGAGRLVGKPAAEMLRNLGAIVSVVTESEGSLMDIQQADVLVLGAGKPAVVKPDMLKPGVVLLDAGTSEMQGKLAGDADPACAQVASVFTPVPGGIGPVAVAMIFKNLFTLLRKKNPPTA